MANVTQDPWQDVRTAAAAATDVQSAVRATSGWSPEQAASEAERLRLACDLPDPTTAFRALYEILLMREQVSLPDTLPVPLQLRLIEVMWLRGWSADEVRKALSEVFAELKLHPPSIPQGIGVLLEIGYRYRSMKQADRWPTLASRGRCAELMWLSGKSEDEIFKEAREAMRRLELKRGQADQALIALREIELTYRSTAFDDALPDPERRRLAEIMWLRGWTLQQALQQAGAVRSRLKLSGLEKPIESLHEISLRCGGPVSPNPVTDAIDALLNDPAAPAVAREKMRTAFGELRWLRGYSVSQAAERIRRLASMTNTPPVEVLEAALAAARDSYRQRAATRTEKP